MRRIWVTGAAIVLLAVFGVSGYRLVAQQMALVQRNPACDHETVGELIGLQTVLSVAGIVVAFVLGVFFTRRPDKKMVAKAKRALSGDFSGRIAPSEKGALADMALAMDVMSEKIESIEAAYRAEVASRLLIVEQLRHADRLKTVGQLTSGVLHELGTPLTIISGRAKMIEEGDVEGAEAVENARIVVEQTGRMSTLIRTILDFARRGKHTNQIADLNDVISKAVLLLGPVALKQGVTLEWTPADTPMMVAAEVSQLQQVLANLILNAVQASDSSAKVIVQLDSVTVAHPDGPKDEKVSCVLLSVVDYGAGIAPEHIDNVFDSFFTTKKAGSGTGLGLAIARQIAIEHGGWISVDSESGRGSTFKVYLPRKDQ
ncbi:MAG: HAMP domain-containing histidine kinase [Deltaproteobacteria bacterium]|nr:HAMP domain-containing histidine kinase [Deltaproteobacteria bacterium]